MSPFDNYLWLLFINDSKLLDKKHRLLKFVAHYQACKKKKNWQSFFGCVCSEFCKKISLHKKPLSFVIDRGFHKGMIPDYFISSIFLVSTNSPAVIV